MLRIIKPGWQHYQPGDIVDPASHQVQWLIDQGFAVMANSASNQDGKPKRSRKAKGI